MRRLNQPFRCPKPRGQHGHALLQHDGDLRFGELQRQRGRRFAFQMRDLRQQVGEEIGKWRNVTLCEIIGNVVRHHQSDTERPIGDAPHRADFLPQALGRVERRAQYTEAAGGGDGTGQWRESHAPHAGGEDRHLDVEQIADRRSQHGHGNAPWRDETSLRLTLESIPRRLTRRSNLPTFDFASLNSLQIESAGLIWPTAT